MGGAEPEETTRVLTGAAVPAAVVLLALWGLVAPYLGQALGLRIVTEAVVEVVDHVVPAVVALVVGVLAYRRRRMVTAGFLLVAIAAVWMTGTHVPLVIQALEGGAPGGAAAWHSLPGALLLVVVTAAAVAAVPAPAE